METAKSEEKLLSLRGCLHLHMAVGALKHVFLRATAEDTDRQTYQLVSFQVQWFRKILDQELPSTMAAETCLKASKGFRVDAGKINL